MEMKLATASPWFWFCPVDLSWKCLILFPSGSLVNYLNSTVMSILLSHPFLPTKYLLSRSVLHLTWLSDLTPIPGAPRGISPRYFLSLLKHGPYNSTACSRIDSAVEQSEIQTRKRSDWALSCAMWKPIDPDFSIKCAPIGNINF